MSLTALDWNPYLTYTWTIKQIQEWFDTYGRWTFYSGLEVTLKYEKIGPNRYHVYFVKYEAKP